MEVKDNYLHLSTVYIHTIVSLFMLNFQFMHLPTLHLSKALIKWSNLKELMLDDMELAKRVHSCCHEILLAHLIPGSGRARGGEFAAEDCWLDGIHGDRIFLPSYCNFGVVAPEVFRGETLAEIILGVPVGVKRGVM